MAQKRKRSPSVVFLRETRTALPPFNTAGDFTIRTAQDTCYHVSYAILAFASPYFRNLPLPPQNEPEPFVLSVPESDATVETLLRLTYPMEDPILQDLEDVSDAYDAAQKYELAHAAARLQRMLLLPRFLDDDPVHVYAVARRYGLVAAANTAADAACRRPQAAWPICDAFAHAPGMAYQDLVLYHRRRAAAAAAALQATTLFSSEKWCRRCTGSWFSPYLTHIRPLLAEAPLRDDVFTLEYLFSTPELTGCDTCAATLARAMRPGGLVHKLKAEVRAAPLRAVQD